MAELLICPPLATAKPCVCKPDSERFFSSSSWCCCSPMGPRGPAVRFEEPESDSSRGNRLEETDGNRRPDKNNFRLYSFANFTNAHPPPPVLEISNPNNSCSPFRRVRSPTQRTTGLPSRPNLPNPNLSARYQARETGKGFLYS